MVRNMLWFMVVGIIFSLESRKKQCTNVWLFWDQGSLLKFKDISCLKICKSELETPTELWLHDYKADLLMDVRINNYILYKSK